MRHNLSFQEHQKKLVALCRGVEDKQIPGASGNRLKTYRRLIFNAFEETLRRAYPITVRVIGEKQWNILVEKFTREYESSSPQLWKMPLGLLQYVSETKYASNQYPFLENILEFEWREIELQMMPDQNLGQYRQVSNPLTDQLILNPYHKISILQYPVFKYPVSQLTREVLTPLVGNYMLLTLRDLTSDTVRYLELSPVAALIVDVMSEIQHDSGQSILRKVSEAMQLSCDERLLLNEQHVLDELIRNQTIIGARIR